jgi:ATP-binding cassette subfamily B protein
MRNQIYRKLQKLSFSFHDRTQAGQLLARATSDVERQRRITGRGFLRLVDSSVLLIGTAIILFGMQPLLAALSLAAMPFVLILVRWYVQRVHPLWHSRQDRVALMTSRLEQNLLGASVVRGFAQEDAEIARFDAENDVIYDLSMQATRFQASVNPLIVLLASASTVFILWVGGRMVIAGALSLGGLVAFNSYLLQLINPMRRIGIIANMLGESRASADRVFEILDAESEVKDRPGARDAEITRGEVAFDHVSFAYFHGPKVLDDISFHVAPGQTVALLGPTGSGKSTITNLIPRFYDVTAGALRIDGMDIRDLTLAALRQRIGIVLQETILFGSTIRENITFGRPEATQEELESAAKAAAAHDFIMQMSDGYDTAVGERGVTLSGGQRQRLAIARAILLDPAILILDDATSSVDTETEQVIQRALALLMHGRTSFVIAQRVSTVRNADLILVIDRGHLVAQGQHHELIRESGVYAEIYHRQLRHQEPAGATARLTQEVSPS